MADLRNTFPQYAWTRTEYSVKGVCKSHPWTFYVHLYKYETFGASLEIEGRQEDLEPGLLYLDGPLKDTDPVKVVKALLGSLTAVVKIAVG